MTFRGPLEAAYAAPSSASGQIMNEACERAMVAALARLAWRLAYVQRHLRPLHRKSGGRVSS